MKTIIIISTVFLILLLSSCDFRQSINKDLITKSISRGNGLSCENISLEVNGKKIKRNTFIFGEKVVFIFDGIEGFKKINSQKYPAMSMKIIKNKKDTVLYEPNLLKGLTNGTDLNPLQLLATLKATLPYKNQEKYSAHIKIWDTKSEGTFTYEFPFEVQKNPLLTIQASSGVTYSNIYLWNETKKQVVTDKKNNLKDLYIVILDGVSGLNAQNENVFPVFSVKVTDGSDNVVLSNSNVLQAYETKGVNAKTFTDNQITLKINFGKGQINNPFILKATLQDKKTSKQIKINANLELY